MYLNSANLIFEKAKEKNDTETLKKLGDLMEKLIFYQNMDLRMKLLGDDYYRMLFGSLEFSKHNYDSDKNEKKQEFLSFLERESKFKIVEPGIADTSFEELVKIRFRLNLLMEYVLVPQTPEFKMAIFFQVRQQSLILDDEFFECPSF